MLDSQYRNAERTEKSKPSEQSERAQADVPLSETEILEARLKMAGDPKVYTLSELPKDGSTQGQFKLVDQGETIASAETARKERQKASDNGSDNVPSRKGMPDDTIDNGGADAKRGAKPEGRPGEPQVDDPDGDGNRHKERDARHERKGEKGDRPGPTSYVDDDGTLNVLDRHGRLVETQTRDGYRTNFQYDRRSGEVVGFEIKDMRRGEAVVVSNRDYPNADFKVDSTGHLTITEHDDEGRETTITEYAVADSKANEPSRNEEVAYIEDADAHIKGTKHSVVERGEDGELEQYTQVERENTETGEKTHVRFDESGTATEFTQQDGDNTYTYALNEDGKVIGVKINDHEVQGKERIRLIQAAQKTLKKVIKEFDIETDEGVKRYRPWRNGSTQSSDNPDADRPEHEPPLGKPGHRHGSSKSEASDIEPAEHDKQTERSVDRSDQDKSDAADVREWYGNQSLKMENGKFVAVDRNGNRSEFTYREWSDLLKRRDGVAQSV